MFSGRDTNEVIVSHSQPIKSDIVQNLNTSDDYLSILKRDFPQTNQSIFTFDAIVNDIQQDKKSHIYSPSLQQDLQQHKNISFIFFGPSDSTSNQLCSSRNSLAYKTMNQLIN